MILSSHQPIFSFNEDFNNIHSRCGNTYLIAKQFHKEFTKRNQDIQLYRVKDTEFTEQPDWTPKVKELLEEMMKLPVATPEVILESDLILMGSPTYFGNVSADMKRFIDECSQYYPVAAGAGKRLGAFTSCGAPDAGGDMCLSAFQVFGNMMGMTLVPIPANLMEQTVVWYRGIIQYSYLQYADKLDDRTLEAIEKYTEYLL
jgi:NAD(P)H dehydrogenase (quinone)